MERYAYSEAGYVPASGGFLHSNNLESPHAFEFARFFLSRSVVLQRVKANAFKHKILLLNLEKTQEPCHVFFFLVGRHSAM